MLIVETISQDREGAKAGIQPGDWLLSYDGLPLPSPAALQALEENAFGKQSLLLLLEREGQQRKCSVPRGSLGIQTRPDLPGILLKEYKTGSELFLNGEFAGAGRQWEYAASHADESAFRAWLLNKAGEAWEKVPDWQQAVLLHLAVWKALLEDGDTALQSQAAKSIGRCYKSKSEWTEAARWYERADQIDQRMGYEMWHAHCLNNLGHIAYDRDDVQAAKDYFTHALAIQERLAPDSLNMAVSFNNLGDVFSGLGNLKEAEDYHFRALQIQECLAPNSLAVAVSLLGLGNVAANQGDLQSAQDHYTRALEIQEGLAPDSLDAANSLHNLGNVAYFRGNLQVAQDYYKRALKIRKRLAPESLVSALSLENLGCVAYFRGDLQAAQDHHIHALEIRKRLAPESRDMAGSLHNMGNVFVAQHDLQAAKDYYTDALEIFERIAPKTLETAWTLGNLGEVAYRQGDLLAAEDYHARTLLIQEHIAPDSLDVAATLNSLGLVARDRGNIDEAKDKQLRALTITERMAPDSLSHSDILAGLGETFLRQKQFDAALPYLDQAVQVLERQRSSISSPENRALLLAQHTAKYACLIQCYLNLNQPELAFATLERFRARSLLELLAERQIDFAAEAPPELLGQQRSLDQQRERTYNQLAQLSASTEDLPQVDALQQQLRDLQNQQQELTDQMRATSPHYAALQYPQPLSLVEVQTALKPGALLLSYLVDESQTFLFAVTADNIQVYSRPLGRQTLQTKVHSLRELLDWRHGTNRIEANVKKANDLGSELYTDLIQPASDLLGNASRLLICADGPLHILPFAALVTNSPSKRGKPRYLGVEKPLQSILSATLYAQSRALSPLPAMDTQSIATDLPPDRSSRSASMFRRLLAFGDPIYSMASAASASERSHGASQEQTDRAEDTGTVDDSADAILEELQTRGGALGPLPHTRAEVLGLKRLFGEAATVKLGAEATKITALTESIDADVLHFACHALVDAKMPLHSGLVLSRSEASRDGESAGDNGFLQVWEIFQKMRLNAELVVLSACKTGLGQEIRGEGLIGLTRAFQYAGARNLVVSLWEINDASTSVFMEGFYGALKSGARKEEAMREGIAAVAAHPEWSAPYYWSAFVLIGS